MAYPNRHSISIPEETKYRVRDVKDKPGMTYREFLEAAVNEFNPDT